jgi:hypothetical protein
MLADKKETAELRMVDADLNYKRIEEFPKIAFGNAEKNYVVGDIKLSGDGKTLFLLNVSESDAEDKVWPVRILVREEDGSFGEEPPPDHAILNGVRVPLSLLGRPRVLAVSCDANTFSISFDGVRRENAIAFFSKLDNRWVASGEVMTESMCGIEGGSNLGSRMAMSEDGQTLIAGAVFFSMGKLDFGGIVMFRRNHEGKWMQDGPIIVPEDAVGDSQIGDAVGIDANGETIVFSGAEDRDPRFEGGGAWVYQRSHLRLC